MSTIRVNLPDGSHKEVEAGQNALDLAKSLGPRLAKAALGAEINGEVKGLATPLADGDTVAILTFDSEGGKDVFRHSASHVMASAILRVRPDAKLTIGPPIEDGFYYDVDAEPPLTEDDFAAIEKEMEKTVQADYPFERGEWSKDEALAYYERAGNPYKVELIRDLDDGTITYYRHDDFVDLCRGPHLPSTGKIKAFKLLSVAGAYWRGDERRPMLHLIYGTAFTSQ